MWMMLYSLIPTHCVVFLVLIQRILADPKGPFAPRRVADLSRGRTKLGERPAHCQPRLNGQTPSCETARPEFARLVIWKEKRIGVRRYDGSRPADVGQDLWKGEGNAGMISATFVYFCQLTSAYLLSELQPFFWVHSASAPLLVLFLPHVPFLPISVLWRSGTRTCFRVQKRGDHAGLGDTRMGLPRQLNRLWASISVFAKVC